MKTLKVLIVGLVAFGAAAFAPEARADWHHHHYYSHYHYVYGRPVVIYDGPHYYSRPYYYDYGYYGPAYSSYYYSRPYYYGGPSISFAFGGSGSWFHHYHGH